MNLSAYHPLSTFDSLAIGIALLFVLAVFGWRLATGRPIRRTLPPDEIDADGFTPAQLPQNQLALSNHLAKIHKDTKARP